MVPAAITDKVVDELSSHLERGDTIIDGGNSYFRDDRRRSARLKQSGIHYLDVGTSGGVWGLERGYCMMIGGDKEAVDRMDPIFKSLAPGRGTVERTPGREKLGGTAEDGYLHCGPSGAGHFVKMVHNGSNTASWLPLAKVSTFSQTPTQASRKARPTRKPHRSGMTTSLTSISRMLPKFGAAAA